MSKVLINEAVLNWAVERSGKSFDALEDRFPRIKEWASGEAQPTLRQLRDLSKATWTPLGFLFLDSPPEMLLPIKHFRTIDDGTPTSPSVDLLETVQSMQDTARLDAGILVRGRARRRWRSLMREWKLLTRLSWDG